MLELVKLGLEFVLIWRAVIVVDGAVVVALTSSGAGASAGGLCLSLADSRCSSLVVVLDGFRAFIGHRTDSVRGTSFSAFLLMRKRVDE